MSNLRKQNFTLHKKLQEIKDQQQEGDDGDMSDIKGCVKLITNKLLGNNTKNIISDDGIVSLLNTGNVTQSKNQLQNINQLLLTHNTPYKQMFLYGFILSIHSNCN